MTTRAMKLRGVPLVAGLAAVLLVASACGLRTGEDDAAAGVTEEEPCPETPNEDNGCIYLGTVSDLTQGPFAPIAGPITEAQQAFWARVNDEGGIGGYDIDVTTHVEDNEYDPQIHNQVYQEIRGEVFALAQTLGSPTTAAVRDEMDDDDMIAAPASWSSEWLFQDLILQSGGNYCVEAMNAVDYAVDELDAESVVAVHYPGDYGDDAAAGAAIAAEERDLDFTAQEVTQGTDNQTDGISAIMSDDPDLAIIATGPADMATTIGQVAARGFEGTIAGSSPTWNTGLLDSPAAEALQEQYLHVGPWEPWIADTEGHEAMRDALPDVEPDIGYTAGWTWSYPVKAAIEAAVEEGELTREGLREAATSLEEVDYEGMLPPEAGNYAAEANDEVFRESLLSSATPDEPGGLEVEEDLFVGPTAEQHEFDGACFAN